MDSTLQQFIAQLEFHCARRIVEQRLYASEWQAAAQILPRAQFTHDKVLAEFEPPCNNERENLPFHGLLQPKLLERPSQC
jgi:hypothetical protein